MATFLRGMLRFAAEEPTLIPMEFEPMASPRGPEPPDEDFWPIKAHVGYVVGRAKIVDRRGDEHFFDVLEIPPGMPPGTICAYEHVDFVAFPERAFGWSSWTSNAPGVPPYDPVSTPEVWREYERYTPAVYKYETVWIDQLRGQ